MEVKMIKKIGRIILIILLSLLIVNNAVAVAASR